METIVDTLAVREIGDVPLVGDDRWSDEYWDHVRKQAGQFDNDLDLVAGTAWAAFSSGSTGTPRVIIRSASSWSESFSAVGDLLELSESDVVYLPAPLVSSMSLFSLAHARATGAALIVPRNHSIAASDLEQATLVHCTPSALRAIVDAIEAGARHRLRAALIGGAALDPDLRLRAEVAGVHVVSYYGAAELSFVAVDVDGHGLRPFPGVKIRIGAASAADVGISTSNNGNNNNEGNGDGSDTPGGVLWVRSPYFATGYLRTPPATAAAPAGGALNRDDQGWATVGDLVELDPDGRMLFRGRLDGAILSAAATVIPEDVESALRTIDGIDDAVVFGLPNSGAGSLVAALIEMSVGYPRPRARDLREQAEQRMSLTHLPRRWYLTDRLPRNSAGKPSRSQIRAEAINGKLARLD